MNKFKLMAFGCIYIMFCQSILYADLQSMKSLANLEPECTVSCDTDLSMGNVIVTDTYSFAIMVRPYGNTYYTVQYLCTTSGAHPGKCSISCPSSISSVSAKVSGIQLVSAPAGASLGDCYDYPYYYICRFSGTPHSIANFLGQFGVSNSINVSLTNGIGNFLTFGGIAYDSSHGTIHSRLPMGSYVFNYVVSIDY